jgi:phage terminase large subunit-like protein
VTNLETAIQWANDCISDTIPSCKYIKQACKRFLQDIEDPLYFVDTDNIDTMCNFCESFYLTEQTTPTKTVLAPFQKFIICNLFGILRKDNLQKKFRTSYIEVGRGNAKTQTTIFFCLYELLFGNDAQIILAADTTKQVMEIDFDKAKKLCRQIDPSGKEIRILYNKIIYRNNKLIVTSNESKPIDGASGSIMVVDEMHQMKDLSVYNSLKTSLVKRNDNLLFIITTSGTDINSECYKMHQYCTKVLDGTYQDPSQFALVFTIDEGDDYTDEKNWTKPNPLLGIAIDKTAIRSAVLQSQQNEQEKASILSRHFNVWMKENEADAFVLDKYVTRAMVDIKLQDFPNESICVGADLSINDDICSLSYLIIKDGLYYFMNDFFIPEEALTTKRNKERYKEAQAGGYIHILEGNAIDYDILIDHLNKINEHNPIRLISYDKFNAGDFIKKLEPIYYMLTFSQLASGMNKPLREMQRLFLLDKIRIQKNPLTQWMFSNVVLKQGYTGLVTLDKTSQANKVDVVASMADALGGWLIAPEYGFNVF